MVVVMITDRRQPAAKRTSVARITMKPVGVNLTVLAVSSKKLLQCSPPNGTYLSWVSCMFFVQQASEGGRTCTWHPLSSLFSTFSRMHPNCPSVIRSMHIPPSSMLCKPPSLPAVTLSFSSTRTWTLRDRRKRVGSFVSGLSCQQRRVRRTRPFRPTAQFSHERTWSAIALFAAGWRRRWIWKREKETFWMHATWNCCGKNTLRRGKPDIQGLTHCLPRLDIRRMQFQGNLLSKVPNSHWNV